MSTSQRPNVIFIFADQWRAQTTGFSPCPDVHTPNLNRLAEESVNFTNAVSSCPVCSPYRASLMTGQRMLTHGLLINDQPLRPNGPCLAECFRDAGYDTAYIGKWHLDGHGRDCFIPPERRRGFDFWRVQECTHDYLNSTYYGDTPERLTWDGYDALAQTREAASYIRRRETDTPFLLCLSWGPPHGPYDQVPDKYLDLYDEDSLTLRPNVPEACARQSREWTRGYYAHCTALDDGLGILLKTLDEENLTHNTILVFTSDHGDMLLSQGIPEKQCPYEESVRVPFLLRPPGRPGRNGCQTLTAPIDAMDIMPTLLGLCNITVPDSVEGLDFSGYINGGANPSDNVTLLTYPVAFHNYRPGKGGREYRGVRTNRHTYCRDMNGPWLLFDNLEDPYQLTNLVADPGQEALLQETNDLLDKKLADARDEFLPPEAICRCRGYLVHPRNRSFVAYTAPGQGRILEADELTPECIQRLREDGI